MLWGERPKIMEIQYCRHPSSRENVNIVNIDISICKYIIFSILIAFSYGQYIYKQEQL